MHSSTFSYAITRPYPYKWFTPVVIVGFVVFTILFSFLNFVSTGYTLVVEQSSNPNATVRTETWMHHWPSFLTHKVRPSCETVNLPLGSQFFTNQTALKYTLTDVWQSDDGGAGAGYGIAPSLTYYSNIIENCTISSVEIDYDAMDRTASQFAYSEWGAVVRTYASCAIMGVNGSTNFNFTQEYDYVPSSASFSGLYTFLGSDFLSRNKTDRASLWWGESIMSMYWVYSTREMQNIRENQTAQGLTGIRKGTLYFYPNDDATITNMTNQDFFECDFRYIVDEGRGNFSVIFPGTYGDYRQNTQLSYLTAQEAYPNIWQSADVLAKAAYSTVLTDLGQLNAPSNILTDPDQLAYFTSNFSEARRSIANAYPGPADTQYGTQESGPLGTTPSVLSTKYLCQIPQRKSAGNIFVSTLVADLVFLQALWFLFRLFVDSFLLRKRSGINQCEGCAHLSAMTGPTYPEDGYHPRDVSPAPMSRMKEDEVEMGSLRPTARGREREAAGLGTHSRSISQQRLIGPQSMDISRQ